MVDQPKTTQRPTKQVGQLGQALLQHLESLRAAGVQQLGRSGIYSEGTQQEPVAIGPKSQIPNPKSNTTSLLPDLNEEENMASTTAPVSTAPSLEILRDEVAHCTLCDELASTRTQTVFGVGDPQAQLCILGEAPGADEDRLGEPFVGRGGQLLNKILAACRLEREQVYILNVLKCRPPGNRNPTPDEAQNCRRFLERQLQLIGPEFICCMGAVAAQNLLATTTPIGHLRGSVHDYQGIQVVCTYHPAYLLRNPSAKAKTWDDMKLLMGLMGVDLSGA